jgi:acidic leucine-rich nuclear phosphoprotein 32 family protein B
MAIVIDGSTMAAAERNPRRRKLRKFDKVSGRPLARRSVFHVCYSEEEEAEAEAAEEGDDAEEGEGEGEGDGDGDGDGDGEDEEIHAISGIGTIEHVVPTASELTIRQIGGDPGAIVSRPHHREMSCLSSPAMAEAGEFAESTDAEGSSVTTVHGNRGANPVMEALESGEEESRPCRDKQEEGAAAAAMACAELVQRKAEEERRKNRDASSSPSPSSSPSSPSPSSSAEGVCTGRASEEQEQEMEMEMEMEEAEPSAAARCPPCGKLLFCGERREMEDAGVIVPSFAKVFFHGGEGQDRGGCSAEAEEEEEEEEEEEGEEEEPWELHFLGVYDGHGGPQVRSLSSSSRSLV